MKISVIGTGYVGLVSGTCFAETGNTVICVDIDENKIKRLENGNIPIYEPQLDVLFERNVRQGRLQFTTSLKEAVEQTDLIFLALPTPPGETLIRPHLVGFNPTFLITIFESLAIRPATIKNAAEEKSHTTS